MENKRTDAEEIEIDLGEILHVLLQKLRFIILSGVTAATAAFLVSEFILPPIYESTTKVYILNKQEGTSITYSDVQIGTQLTKDYAELVKSRFVLEDVNKTLALGLTYEEMEDKVEITTPADTRILAISVSDESPQMARDIANAIRETAAVHITNVMDIKAVNVVENANLPEEKSKPRVLLWTMAGGGAGSLFVCLIILLKYLLDDTIKSSDDIEKYLGLSTLALIPLVETKESARGKSGKKNSKKGKTGSKQKKIERTGGEADAGSKAETGK